MAATVGGPLSAGWRRHQEAVLLALAAAALVATSLAPLATLAFRGSSAWAGALPFLARPEAVALFARSLALAAAVTAGALALGVPLGVLVGRTDVRGRAAAWLVHLFPAFLPPFVLALGWFQIVGRSGPLGGESASRLFFGEAGLVAVLVLAFAPFVTSLAALGLAALDPSLEEAARTVAGPLRTVARILVPSAAPAIALAAIVVFALAFSELGVASFLRVDTYPAAVFARLGGVDYAPAEALALALPLVPLALVLLALERRLVGARPYTVLGLRSAAAEPIRLGRWRAAGTLVLWAAAVLPLAPLAALAARAAAGGGFASLGTWAGRAPTNGLAAAAAAATAVLAIGLVAGHAAARGHRGAALLDGAAVLAFLAPAALLGAGLIALWNRPGWPPVYGTAGILVVGFVARYAVLGVRSVGVLLAQTPAHLEEAAAAAGASHLRRLARVLVPLHARGLGLVWLLVLVFGLRDLETAVLYYPPGGEPLTVRLFTLEANGPPSVVAALAWLQVALTAAAVGAGSLLLRRRA